MSGHPARRHHFDEIGRHRQSETKENICDPASVSLGYERDGKEHGIRREA